MRERVIDNDLRSVYNLSHIIKCSLRIILPFSSIVYMYIKLEKNISDALLAALSETHYTLRTQTHIHTHTYTRTETQTNSRAQSRTSTRTRPPTRTQQNRPHQSLKNTRTHVQTQVLTKIHTNFRISVRTNTSTHTKNEWLVFIYFFWKKWANLVHNFVASWTKIP